MIDEDQLQRHSRQARDYTRALIDQFDGRLAQTRLIFASFDAEEAGLRGSRAYVRAHRAELAALPTCNLNIDSIYTAEFTMAGVRATTPCWQCQPALCVMDWWITPCAIQ